MSSRADKVERVQRLLCVFEFPPGDAEWQLRDLAEGLRRQQPGLQLSFCGGWIQKYTPGGLRPWRILNGLWVHLRAFFQILFGNYDTVLVRSAPPLIQMTVALTCWVRRIPYWVWLMDAHPEIEHELWSRVFAFGKALSVLKKLNTRCLEKAQIVIVLDEGMRQRLLPLMPTEHVIICPTWGKATATVG